MITRPIEDQETLFVHTVCFPDESLEDIAAKYSRYNGIFDLMTVADVQEIIRQGAERHRAALPDGIADMLLDGKRPETGLICLFAPQIEPGGRIRHDEPWKFSFVIPRRKYEQPVLKWDNFVMALLLASFALPTYCHIEASRALSIAEQGALTSAVSDLKKRHKERYSSFDIFSRAGSPHSNKMITEIRKARSAFDKFPALSGLNHSSADVALQQARHAMDEYLRLYIIQEAIDIDAILDNLVEPLRQLSEFPEIRAALTHSLITGDILNLDNLKKREKKLKDEEKNAVRSGTNAKRTNHIGWGECIWQVVSVFLNNTGTDKEAHRQARDFMNLNFPDTVFTEDDMRHGYKNYSRSR